MRLWCTTCHFDDRLPLRFVQLRRPRHADIVAPATRLIRLIDQHEYQALGQAKLPDNLVILPGVIETTNNFVEHPEVVARRIEEAVTAVGDRERVVASTDCGFGTFAGREWVAEDVVWAKLASLRAGADLASQRLWGRRQAAG